MSGQDGATYESIDVIVYRAAQKTLAKTWDWLDGKSIAGLIEDYTSGRIAPVARGRWAKMHGGLVFVCSCCGCIWDSIDNDTDRFDYCPSCGAKMEVGTDESKN